MSDLVKKSDVIEVLRKERSTKVGFDARMKNRIINALIEKVENMKHEQEGRN